VTLTRAAVAAAGGILNVLDQPSCGPEPHAREGSTPMTTEQTGTLVFKDEAGDYFLVAKETLERARVPAEHKAEVERLLTEPGADLSGYMVSTTYTLFRVLGAGAKAIGDFTADAALVQWLEQQLMSGGPA